eukprot:gb/GECG01016128.1/.p1 GENE.gb/GECG01016128.1/~~gb/GECG01016128.1/.p1  ORF type:complete len:498 (+),score=40.29 gb/GECG01016128.1/:1-1494(+)
MAKNRREDQVPILGHWKEGKEYFGEVEAPYSAVNGDESPYHHKRHYGHHVPREVLDAHIHNTNHARMQWLLHQGKKGWTWTLLLTVVEIAMFLVLPFFNDDKVFPAYEQGQYYLLTALIMFTLFGWGYAMDVRLWMRSGINYARVFNLKGGYVLRRSGIARLSAILASFQLAAAAVCFVIGWRDTQYNGIATALLLVLLVSHILFFTLPGVLHPQSRFFLGRVLLQCFAAPFAYPVTFVANVVADILTSAGTAIYRFQYGLCSLATTGWLQPGAADQHCGTGTLYDMVMLPFATALPFWLRFLQCMSRYFEALWNGKRGWAAHQHLVNALKYASALAVVATDTLTIYQGGKNHETPYYHAWVVALVIKTVYCYVWDVTMDWGLWRTTSPFALRPRTMFSKKFYYVAMVTNAFGRVAWAFGISPHQYPEEWTLWLQTVEVLRRIQWLVFRVENEYISIQECEQLKGNERFVCDDSDSDSTGSTIDDTGQSSDGDDPKH